MKKVYFISGLGANKSVFDQLDLSFCEPVFVDWITPDQKESLQHYALRLAGTIKEKDATIVGLSMGGMMAAEIARENPSMKIIIISSNRDASEFPAYSRFTVKYFPLYQLTTRWILRLIFPFNCWFLGAANKKDKAHLWKIINTTDIPFLKWCIWAIARRKPGTIPPNIIHIHGTSDRLLPYRLVTADHTIEKGGHLMIRNRAQEISELLHKHID